jgi:excisionase family DNA binding protein
MFGKKCNAEIEQKGEGFMEEVLDIKDVSRILKLSQPTIRMKVYKGELAHLKIGRRVLFRPADIAALLDESYRPAKPSAGEHA